MNGYIQKIFWLFNEMVNLVHPCNFSNIIKCFYIISFSCTITRKMKKNLFLLLDCNITSCTTSWWLSQISNTLSYKQQLSTSASNGYKASDSLPEGPVAHQGLTFQQRDEKSLFNIQILQHRGRENLSK